MTGVDGYLPGTVPQQGLPGRRYGIEYLRFALSLAVVFYHFGFYGPSTGRVSAGLFVGDWMVWGRFAVSAFFIISGYVISMSALNKSGAQFLASRISRLYPALLVCSLITAATMLALGVRAAPELGVLLVKPIAFFPMLGGGHMIDGSYWSIVYELRFYALVLILLLVGRFRYLAEILTALGIAGLALHLSGVTPTLLEWLLFPHLSFFALGVILFRIRQSGWAIYLAALGLIHIALATSGAHIGFARVDMFDGQRSGLLSVAAVVVVCLALVAIADRIEVPAAQHKLAGILGGISYPLYLVHQEVGYGLISIGTGMGMPLAAVFSLAVVSVILIALAVFVQFEMRMAGPLRKGTLAILQAERAAVAANEERETHGRT